MRKRPPSHHGALRSGGIGIASGTYAVVEFPPVRLEGSVAERIAAALQSREQTHGRPRS